MADIRDHHLDAGLFLCPSQYCVAVEWRRPRLPTQSNGNFFECLT